MELQSLDAVRQAKVAQLLGSEVAAAEGGESGKGRKKGSRPPTPDKKEVNTTTQSTPQRY